MSVAWGWGGEPYVEDVQGFSETLKCTGDGDSDSRIKGVILTVAICSR